MDRDEGRYHQSDLVSTYYTARSGVRGWFRPGSKRLTRRGLTWHRRYRDSGKSQDLVHALRDLCEAMQDKRSQRWPEYANNFGVALVDAHRHFGTSHLDAAVDWLQEALDETAEGSPLRGKVLANLITAVRTRSELKPHQYDLPDLVELHRELSQTESANVADRLAAAVAWGTEVAEENPAEGLPGLELAVRLLPRAAWWGQTRETREEVLAGHTGLAADAAACAIAAGQPARALELLEGGRAVMWTQVLKTRSDRTALHAVAPRLAQRMDEVAEELERDDGLTADKRMALAERWSTMDEEAHATLLREWESLTARAQQEYPEGTFVTPSYSADLRPAGAEGPVVIVIVSRFGSAAVVVHDQTADEPGVVPLPDLLHEDVETLTTQYVTTMVTDRTARREEVVATTLAELGRAIGRPILEALGEQSRIWWCPTGLLMTLPLHATVLDDVVSSYTPTLRVLVRARERRASATRPKLLHVTVGDDLPSVARTRDHLEELFPEENRTTLDGDAITPKTVAALLDQHAWAHFDCHGVQDLRHPFQGGLVLRGQRLTVADVAGIRHDGAEFAFLAACETAKNSDRVPDESITLAAALQYAGYQSVIGALWPVTDRSTERVARAVYDTLVQDGRIIPALGAQALHDAIRAQRDRMPKHPSVWVPFIHVGL
jgi:hypothetical protein